MLAPLVNEPLRRLFVDHGHPGLGPQARPTVLPAGQIREVVDEALHGTPGLPHARLLALALCWHDHWDESHRVCVAHEGDQDADLVHLVLHRREPDADNCRYWINRTGWHPLFDALPALATSVGLTDLAPAGRWSPECFLDRCLAATAADRVALERMQAAELLGLRDRLLGC